MNSHRITALQHRLAQENVDAIILSRPENCRYVTGFTGSDGYVLITQTGTTILTDFRYVEQVEREAPGIEITRISDGIVTQLPDLVRQHKLNRIVFESRHLTVAEHEKWKEAAPDVVWVPGTEVVESFRMIKDKEELEAIRRAVQLTDRAFAHLLPKLRAGCTELEVAWMLESYVRTHGAERVAFKLIVGSGPNGAMPHATASDRRIEEGEPIVIDIGAVVDGYHSDMTRTLCMGGADGRFNEIYHIVLQAQQNAAAAIMPGMSGEVADDVARRTITDAGYGSQFGHSLGHGVGLSIHEAPRIGPKSTAILEQGMVVTIEPGIYLPGWGGVRIEDLVVITNSGCEILTQSPKDLFAW